MEAEEEEHEPLWQLLYVEGETGSPLAEGDEGALHSAVTSGCLHSSGMSFCRFVGGEVFKDHFKPGISMTLTCFTWANISERTAQPNWTYANDSRC